MKISEDIIVLKDPHHDGSSEYTFFNNKFYHRCTCCTKWTEIKRFKATKARVKMLYRLTHHV